MTEPSLDKPAAADPVAKTHAGKRTPALAFLIGAAAVGAVGVAAYLLWPEPAQAPVTVTEARITDEVPAMPVPDGDAIRARVDSALAASPRDLQAPSEQAAAAASAQTAPEARDTQPLPAPAAQ